MEKEIWGSLKARATTTTRMNKIKIMQPKYRIKVRNRTLHKVKEESLKKIIKRSMKSQWSRKRSLLFQEHLGG